MENQSSVTEFLLVGFLNDPPLQIFLFLVFFMICLLTLVGNMMIMLVIWADPQLNTPYFFLSHLAFVDICYSSAIVPKMLVNFLVKHKTISAPGCLAQMFFIFLSSGVEVFLLSAMAYDQFAAICHPLRDAGTMNKHISSQLVHGSWAVGLLYSLINTVPVLMLHFRGPNEIRHFSCELLPLLWLSCSATFANKIALLSSAVMFGVSSFLLTLVSYIYISSTILQMRSTEGRQKAFSTCSSHLIVVGLLFATALSQYMKPSSVTSTVLDEFSSIQYSILTPMLTPIIYSLHNKDVKTALARIVGKMEASCVT